MQVKALQLHLQQPIFGIMNIRVREQNRNNNHNEAKKSKCTVYLRELSKHTKQCDFIICLDKIAAQHSPKKLFCNELVYWLLSSFQNI